MTERERNLLRALSDAKAPSGFEDEAVAIMREALNGVCDFERDGLNNLYIRRRKNTGDKPLLMLDAHSDEVGFMVHSIRENGTLRIVGLGGWNRATLPGAGVLVRNKRGEWIKGSIAAKPPHFMSAEEKARDTTPEYRDLALDIGATSGAEAENTFGIRIGEPVVPAERFWEDTENGLFFGKAFDCRIGCAAMAEVMRTIADETLSVDVVASLSSQEEVGERGAKAAVNRIRPDIAIVFEGCPADDTFTEPYAVQTRLKGGPMLRFMDVSVIINPRFQRFALDLAEQNGIAAQASVREGGGNDAAVIQALNGAPAIVLGVPVRYIHTPACIASAFDYEETVRLALAIIRALDAERIRSF
jgi:putative aminopeptidase FrvX